LWHDFERSAGFLGIAILGGGNNEARFLVEEEI
jgi:hypothetical protein